MNKIKYYLKPEFYLPIIIIIIGTVIPIFFFDEETADVLFGVSTYTISLFVLVLFIRYLIIKSNEEQEINKVKSRLSYNLNNKDVYLIDYENTGILPRRTKDTDENTIYYVFAGKNQNKRIKNELRLLSIKSKIQVIYIDKSGKNLLDIGLGMYVGAIYTLYKPKTVYIYSKDKGYKSLIQIAEDFGYHNLFNIGPEQDIVLKDRIIKALYNNIQKNTYEREMSIGNFKKRIKKSRLEITPDEVNYTIKRLKDLGFIEITDGLDTKTVIMK